MVISLFLLKIRPKTENTLWDLATFNNNSKQAKEISWEMKLQTC